MFCLLAISLCFTACKKDDDNGTFVADDLSIDGGWSPIMIDTDLDEQSAAIVANIDPADLGGIAPDIYEQYLNSLALEMEALEDCKKDDFYVFFRSALVGFRNNDTVCEIGADPSTDAIIPDEAGWSASGQTLTISLGGGEQVVYTIVTLNNGSLILETTSAFRDDALNIGTDDQVTTTYTFEQRL